MLFNRIEWAAARLLFLLTFAFCFFTFIGIYLVAPLISYYYFGTLRFWKRIGYFPPMARFAYRHAAMIFLDTDYRRVFSIPFTAPPADAPVSARVRVADSWPMDAVGCNGCTRCCDKIGCPLIDRRGGKCLAYGTFYWRYFNCGRYPETEAQIAYYACPKWRIPLLPPAPCRAVPSR